jgi:hypothetical protein
MSREPWRGTVAEMCDRLTQIGDEVVPPQHWRGARSAAAPAHRKDAELQYELDRRFEEEREARRNPPPPLARRRRKQPKHQTHSANGGTYVSADPKPSDREVVVANGARSAAAPAHRKEDSKP